MVKAQARAGGRPPRGELRLQRVLQPDQHDMHVRLARLKLKRSRNRHMRAVVAPHAVDRYGDQLDYSSLVLATFLPR
jgi:hypothetical protein